MRYLLAALFSLQVACKVEPPKNEDNKGVDVIYLGQPNLDAAMLVIFDYGIDAESDQDNFVSDASALSMQLPPPSSRFARYDWNFLYSKLTISGICVLERAVTAQEADQLQSLLKTFEYCQYKGPIAEACPSYFMPNDKAVVNYNGSIFSIDSLPLDGCGESIKTCRRDQYDKLKALHDELTKNDLENCAVAESN